MVSSSVRERALRDAFDLFYAEGINATGVNRVAEHLGMSKRTLYELFDTKDNLVVEALAARDAEARRMYTSGPEVASDDPSQQIVALFSGAEQLSGQAGFRGCPYLNAAAELADPGHGVHRVVQAHKEGLRRWIERKARAARLRHPRQLSQQLMMLFDGLMCQAAQGAARPGVALGAARALVDAARSQS